MCKTIKQRVKVKAAPGRLLDGRGHTDTDARWRGSGREPADPAVRSRLPEAFAAQQVESPA